MPEQRPVEPPYQAPSPAERPGPLRPGEDAPPTRVEHDEGVIVLSNRGDTRPRASGEHEDVASESSQPVPAASDAPKQPTEQHGADPGADRAAHAFRDLEPVRSNRKRSRDDDEAGFGWVWGLVGAAVILLVPIGFLLNRGTRAPSTPPITRRSSSSEPPDSTSDG